MFLYRHYWESSLQWYYAFSICKWSVYSSRLNFATVEAPEIDEKKINFSIYLHD
jgi:hypothetical protein